MKTKRVSAKHQRVRRLAAFQKNGKIAVNPQIRGESRRRVVRHMTMFRAARRQGLSFTAAYRKALNAEHAGLTKHQVQVYEGHLGAIARWRPMHKRSVMV